MRKLVTHTFLFLVTLNAIAAVSDSDLKNYIEGGDKGSLVKALKSGVDANRRIDKKQHTLLHIAVINGEDKLVKELVKHGADVNAKDIEGKTPLHFAATGNSSWVITYLASKGANPGLKDKAGKYPLDLAKESGDQGKIMQLNVVGMMANQKGGNAPTGISNQQQKMMQRFIASRQQQANKNKPKQTNKTSSSELAKKVAGQWVNLKSNHIVTFHQNGRFEGVRKKNIRWQASSGNQIRFSEVKLSGFGGFSKSVKLTLRGDKLFFYRSEFVAGEYQRATPSLLAEVKTRKAQRQQQLARSLKQKKTTNNPNQNKGPRTRTLRSVYFNWTDQRNKSFANTYFDNTSFFKADLRGVDFSGAKINDSSFAYANLEGASFKNAIISRSMFTGANLANVDFTGAKFEHTNVSYTNRAVKAKDDVNKNLAGLWVIKQNKYNYFFKHIFSDGFYIDINNKRVSGVENFYSVNGGLLNAHSSQDLYSSRRISGYLAVGGSRFEVDDKKLRIYGLNGTSTTYSRATTEDWEKYKVTLYRNHVLNFSMQKRVIILEKLFANGFTWEDMRKHRLPRLFKLTLADASNSEKQHKSALLIKLFVEQGMDYRNHLRNGRIPLAEAAVKGQLEALRYLLSVDKREDVIEIALREKSKFANQQAVKILEEAAKQH